MRDALKTYVDVEVKTMTIADQVYLDQKDLDKIFNVMDKLDTKNILLEEENVQLKEQIKIYEKFLEGNDLDIEWDLFCRADECILGENEEMDCKDCKYMRWDDD